MSSAITSATIVFALYRVELVSKVMSVVRLAFSISVAALRRVLVLVGRKLLLQPRAKRA
jgi:hypothetical protein